MQDVCSVQNCKNKSIIGFIGTSLCTEHFEYICDKEDDDGWDKYDILDWIKFGQNKHIPQKTLFGFDKK